jgi:ADP-heptose:LPS heptosyltransferase
MGDLVLVETLLAGLRDREPGVRIELLCRESVALVPGLYREPPHRVIPIPFNPYRWDPEPGDLAAADVRALAERIADGVDVLIAAEQNPSPLGPCLASVIGAGELIVGSTKGHEASRKVHVLLRKLGVDPCASVRRLDPIAGEHELDRYARLAGSARRTPNFRPIQGGKSATRKLLVFPFNNSAFRVWPHEQMVLAATRIAERYDLSIELVASANEQEAVADLARSFPHDVAIRTGSPAELPDIAVALSSASGYLSVDTGLAQLAAAYGVPGVTIYGGGTWPKFAPWGSHAAGVVAPLPCFGCRWDCAFDRAFCLERITADPVVEAFDAVYERTGAGPISVAIDPYDAREQAIMDAAAAKYRGAQEDRREKFDVIMGLREACDERLALIQTLTAEVDRRARPVTEAEPERDDALVAECDRLRERILDLERTAQARDDEIALLSGVCDERMHEIERITAEAERRSALLADMTAAFEAALRRLEREGAGRSPAASRTAGA